MSNETRIRNIAGGLIFSLAAINAGAACVAPPAAVIDIDANRYYSDAHNSMIDPVLKARNEAATKPVDEFLAQVATLASAYHADPRGKTEDATCALGWLSSWADQKAMLGKLTTEQSYYTRKWALSGMALSYAKVKHAASGAQKQSIETWLKTLAEATLEHSEAHKGERNNHYYWEGLAVTAAGAVTGEKRLLDWGRKVFDHAMSQVQPDGSLPREMGRAVKALHYHAFGVTPLVMIASILDIHAPKLDKLVEFTVRGAKDPSAIEKATGFVQEIPGRSGMSWEVIYARHENKPNAGAIPLTFNPRLGGDLSRPNPLEHAGPKS